MNWGPLYLLIVTVTLSLTFSYWNNWYFSYFFNKNKFYYYYECVTFVYLVIQISARCCMSAHLGWFRTLTERSIFKHSSSLQFSRIPRILCLLYKFRSKSVLIFLANNLTIIRDTIPNSSIWMIFSFDVMLNNYLRKIKLPNTTKLPFVLTSSYVRAALVFKFK